jgi:fructokinase
MKDTIIAIGIGELLWDLLPEGKKLGGAPCNFVYHAQQHGAKAFAISAIGDDDYGKEILAVLDSKDISTKQIQVNDKPTGTVDVLLDERGIPEYTIHEGVAWDFLALNEDMLEIASQADVICFGSLAQRSEVSRETIAKLLRCSKPEAIVVCDINLRQQFYSKAVIEESLMWCNVLKLNEDELPVISELLEVESTAEEAQISELLERFNLSLVAFTQGSEGSLLVTPHEKSYLSTPRVDVKDTVGAGDSFTAAMTVGFALGEPLKEIHQKAVDLSAFVCTQDGAMPEYQKL